MDFTTVNFEHPQTIDRCAYYGRVSTPRQNLEHQREHVLRWCEGSSVVIPDWLHFADKEKRHKSAKRGRSRGSSKSAEVPGGRGPKRRPIIDGPDVPPVKGIGPLPVRMI